MGGGVVVVDVEALKAKINNVEPLLMAACGCVLVCAR